MSKLTAGIVGGIRLKNFKALRNVDLDLSKINLLMGKNSTGKSSLIQAMSMLKQSLRAGRRMTCNGYFVHK